MLLISLNICNFFSWCLFCGVGFLLKTVIYNENNWCILLIFNIVYKLNKYIFFYQIKFFHIIQSTISQLGIIIVPIILGTLNFWANINKYSINDDRADSDR